MLGRFVGLAAFREKAAARGKRPVSASKCRSVVNRKAGENFEVRNIWLRNHGEFELVSLERGRVLLILVDL
jgi:hypothetical protein